MGQGVGWVDIQPLRRGVFAPDQRFGQAMRVRHVVEPEPPLNAKAVFIGRAAGAVHLFDLAILDLEGQLAADAAIGTDRLHLFIKIGAVALTRLVKRGSGHQGAGRAGLHAFAAGDAS